MNEGKKAPRITKEWMALKLREIEENLAGLRWANLEAMKEQHERGELTRIINSISAYSVKNYSRSPKKKQVALEIMKALATRWDMGH